MLEFIPMAAIIGATRTTRPCGSIMNRPFRSLGAAVLFCGATFQSEVSVEAQITVNGLADKAIYNDTVTFTVPSESGYDFLVLLDTNRLLTDVPATVTSVEYHELQVYRTNQTTLDVTNRLIRFIVRSSERGSTEDGIPPWTPYPVINSSSNEFVGAHLRVITPQDFPAGHEIPVIAWVENDEGHAVRANGFLSAPGQPSIQIRRGVGSGFLSSNNPPGNLTYATHIEQLQASNTINLESNTVWTSVSGTLSGTTTWLENSRMAVTGDVTIPAGSTLNIGAGSIVRLNSGVDINLNGTMTIAGTTNQPVVFMPMTPSQPWGGLLLTANTSQLTATGTIFTGSGAVQNWFGSNGHPHSHRPEQALFYCTNSPIITFADCAAIFLSGQLSHAVNGGTFNYTHFLMQHATTGGEHTGASFRVNDSAFIDFPDDTADFVDGDNDALYIVNGTHGFTNTLFGWTKDDGVDSGGSGGGLLDFVNCWFESTLHEGNALSGNGKIINHFNSVFINCGQGLEDGYDSPVGTMYHCLALGNLVGGRFGDNYSMSSYAGFLRATNSILIYNHRDVFGVDFLDWTYRTNSMDVRSNYLSAPNDYHPGNLIWQAADGWQLGDFMSVPGTDVGIGIATRQTQFDLDAITNGLPVGLSCFTTNTVSVDYAVETPDGAASSGTVQFLPGETVKFIPLAAPSGEPEIARVRIFNPVHGEVTGNDAVYFLRPAATNATLISAGAVWRYLDTGEDAGTVWRAIDFDDGSWLSGPAQLGYGDGDEATVVRSNGISGRIITTYFRRTFVVSDPRTFANLTVDLKRDDGGIVCLNGIEIFRSNITNAPVNYQTFAFNAADDGTVFYSANAPASLLVAGTNVVAVEIHQVSLTSSDISFDLELTATPRPALQLAHFGSDSLLVWGDAGAVLQHADDVTGPWSDISASAPLQLDFNNAQGFYRLRSP